MADQPLAPEPSASAATAPAATRYVLADDVALRSWENLPYGVQRKKAESAERLKPGEFWLAMACDGSKDLTPAQLASSSFDSLVKKGLIRPANAHEPAGASHLSSWQKLKNIPHRYVPSAKITITGKCNFNCNHCFMAADNAPMMGELSKEQIFDLLDQFQEAGIQWVSLNGGETMLHPHFEEILHGIVDRGMNVRDITTNGAFITREMLRDWKTFLDPLPYPHISFDGLGHHDWMRGRKGVEAKTLEKIALCVEEGVPAMVNMQLWKGNLDTVMETLQLLAEMGVPSTRVVRTTESPRWLEQGGGQTLGLEEYLKVGISIAAQWMATQSPMELEIWQMIKVVPSVGAYKKNRSQEDPDRMSLRGFSCCDWPKEMCVNYDGEMVPCIPFTGYLEHHGYSLGNALKTPIAQILSTGPYAQLTSTRICDLMEHNEECAACPYVMKCAGGCRAIACSLEPAGDFYVCDRSRCAYFKNGIETMIDEAMAEVSRKVGRPVLTLDEKGRWREAKDILAERVALV